MSRNLTELESILQQLLAEHRRLVALLDAQQKAMKTFDVNAMSDSANQQEACRLRINGLESRRRLVAGNLAGELRVPEPITLKSLATLLPPRAPALLKLRGELRGAMDAISSRTIVSGRIAGAVLGHLNTVFRLFAGAIGKAGLYTRDGIPRVPGRIGVMEAIG
jgi:hypothetical protein